MTDSIAIDRLPKALFVTGIGTDVGKSYATGWLAREIARAGGRVITQKLIQTGNDDFSEDIDVHRKVMGMPYTERDMDHTTAPIILSYPCSPDLAAKIDGIALDFDIARRATETLLREYDHVLIEGAGGIMVPLIGEWLQLDYVRENGLPAVIVTNGQLGSINHTLLTILALRQAGVEIYALIYNPHFDKDARIVADTLEYLEAYLRRNLPDTLLLKMPVQL